MTSSHHRRSFLRSSGITLALPFLESLRQVAAESKFGAGDNERYRMVAIGVPFGMDPVSFIPSTVGKNYKLPPHLQPLAELRDDFSVISGLSHPNTGSGMHKSEAVMLTGAAYPDYSHNLKNTISIDQQFATHFRGETRYDSFVLTTYDGTLSYTNNGVAIPAIDSPSTIYQQLFLTGSQTEATEQLERLAQGRSLLDTIGRQAKQLRGRVSATDRRRIDEYFSSVRDVERQLKQEREWAHRSKPKPIGAIPNDIPSIALQSQRLRLMMDMVHLALATDSTRAVTIRSFGMHHDLSHHGKEPKKLARCRAVETELLGVYAAFLQKLKSSREGNSALLDRTMVLLTSNLRDGNTHRTHDLPVLLAGGGFRHGQHLAFNRDYVRTIHQPEHETSDARTIVPIMGVNQTPLCNLFTSMMQKAGIETDHFGSSSGTLTGLT